MRDADLGADLPALGQPTLVIGGIHDTSTPPAEVRALAQAIPGARYCELDAAHLSNWAVPAEFNRAVAAFLSG